MSCLAIRGCSGNCDEQPLHTQPGHRRVASLCHCALAAVAVPRQRALLSSRHGASPLLGCVRPAGWLPAAVALVAAVRVQLPSPHRLVATISPPAMSPPAKDLQMRIECLKVIKQKTFPIISDFWHYALIQYGPIDQVKVPDDNSGRNFKTLSPGQPQTIARVPKKKRLEREGQEEICCIHFG